ncbi:MAG: xylosidase [Bacteroidales bacterium]|nr:xylosidase [Bacteroidales bacterium]
MKGKPAAQNRHGKDLAHPEYEGLVMAGYQGWFHLPRSGVMYPDENRIHIDMWPDVSEYENTYPTGLRNADGSVARFFCSDDEQTVRTHFRWMQEYGLDGVFLQRFYGSCRPVRGTRKHSVTVLRHAMTAAQEYDRAFAVMYDLSGLSPEREETCDLLQEDWKFLVDSMKVTSYGPRNEYLGHQGKPLVVIWGVGFPDRTYDIRKIKLAELIDFLHNDPDYGGCTVMLGVPTYWRDLCADCTADPYLHTLIRMADLVLPWMVQRFTPLLHFEMNRYRDHILKDTEWCERNGVGYVPLVYPGFSWYNLSRGGSDTNDIGGEKPLGSIPRQGGKFYWDQIYTAIGAGAKMLYVAMFDEVNEGTAIFKCTDTPPVSDVAKFVGMDGQPSDHYLFLTGEGARMLRGERPLDKAMPVR